ncbi:protein SEH1 [Quillaja saponaria]|uniref:Protein SEH1 n=1 Tax=Quillaja saponaria TaxID=32244 RepID=A0AAD7PER5_QUISA|nr:protein SEH1 [Quillaja saponaria]
MDMAKSLVTLDNGTNCSSWNYCCQILITGSVDGSLSIFDPRDPAFSSPFTYSFKYKVHEGSILKEEVAEDALPIQWMICTSFKSSSTKVLDIQFGISSTRLKMVAAYSDGHVKVYELLGSLEMNNWQLQAEYHNVTESLSSFGKAIYFSTLYLETCIEVKARTPPLCWVSIQIHQSLIRRYRNLIRLINDGFLWQSWLCLEKEVNRFILLHGHQTLAAWQTIRGDCCCNFQENCNGILDWTLIQMEDSQWGKLPCSVAMKARYSYHNFRFVPLSYDS